MEQARSASDQGLERSSHRRPPISDPPSQTPHLKPPSQVPSPPPQTPRYWSETTISGPDNVGCYVFRARPQYQAPNMTPTISDPRFFVWDYNIRPRQCRLLRFSRETTISGPKHDTYNLRPHAVRARLLQRSETLEPSTHFSGNLSAAHIYEPTWRGLFTK